jgi:3-deoxy-D-manno-octulosonic acid (KDO) 8-phosphate synthase
MKVRLLHYGTKKCEPDRTIPNNKPDFIIRNNNKGSCMLMGVTNTGERNVTKKEAEKILKYKDLILEIQGIWYVKAQVIPVITGATGTISKPDNTWATYQESTKLRNYKKTSHIGH